VCGIVGYAGRETGLSPATLIQMRDTLMHRGPDGAGCVAWNRQGEVCREGEPVHVGLAHRRLSIIDLSAAGAQPMSNEDGTIWITYNGEFYNFQEYRQELEQKGHVFRSQCDTETILHLYEEYGIEATLARMNGMFAFGMWDARKQRLILARDRLGKKPLYYAHLPDGSLLFASEIKALLASGRIEPEAIDPVALDQFWTLGVPIGERTIYAGIRQLPAASYAVWQAGKLTVRQYWDCPFREDADASRSVTDWADELESLLSDAIRLRLIADVPLGLFLSGGIDSSLIAALTKKVLKRDVQAFTIQFDRAEFDESTHAQAVANHLSLENVTLPVNLDRRDEFERIVDHFDMPFGDASAIPTYYVSQAARDYVTVALTGDGGDELFAGYDWFKDALAIWGNRTQRRWFGRPMPARERLWLWRLRLRGLRRGLSEMQSWTGRRLRRQIFSDSFLGQVDPEARYADRNEWYDQARDADALGRMQYVNVKVNLVDDILAKVDRMSMAHGLECRSPLLDYRVVELAARLPFAGKFGADGRGKHILREVLYRHVPAELFDRPKQGFCIPWEHWCAGDYGADLRQRWEQMNHPWFRPEAGALLFPPGQVGSAFRQWNAFAMLVYLGR
jgi:asparagine synthase (glutamine-hydrolysing)